MKVRESEQHLRSGAHLGTKSIISSCNPWQSQISPHCPLPVTGSCLSCIDQLILVHSNAPMPAAFLSHIVDASCFCCGSAPFRCLLVTCFFAWCRSQPRQLYGRFPNAQSAPDRAGSKQVGVANTSTRARFLWGLVSQRLVGAIRARRAMQGT